MIRSIAAKVSGVAVAAACVLTAVPAHADDPAPPKRQGCAWVRQIDSFNEIDDYTAIVQTSPSRRFKVTFVNRCRELKWSFAARVEGYGSCLRPGDRIIVGRRPFHDRCIVRSVEPLPPRQRTAMNSN